MLNPKTNEKTLLTLTLMTAGQKGEFAATAIIHAPSGLERCISVSGNNKDQVAIDCLAKAINKGITGRNLDIMLETDSKYLNSMFGGEYRRKLANGEQIEFAESWKMAITMLKGHQAKISLEELTVSEVSERAKATAKFWTKKTAPAEPAPAAETEVA